MQIDIQLLYMVASVTKNWPAHANAIEDFCHDNWYTQGILPYMHSEFICSKEPITNRLYELDDNNQELVIKAIKSLGRNLCPVVKDIDIEDLQTHQERGRSY